ncbi:MAG: hypothetical protein IJY91_07675 [Oscillospiraceae bacterium]|nr:hypothetical protein [Oscillospiraceae bacterium]
MRRYAIGISMLPLLIMSLSGCHAIGDKSASLSVIYCVTALLSLIMLIVYCCVAHKKDPWFLLLFASVLIVNIGYVALAISRSLDEALLANRVAYLGSVFLPLSMCMIILNVTRIQYRRWLPVLMLAIGVLMFFIAASPGYLDIYYKEVFFEKINGVTVLNKVYGPLHGLYLIYLLGYFSAMVITIVRATVTDKIDSIAYAAILAIAVFVNIGVWMIEQLVRIDFEILSVSYIISESFLLGLHLFMAETEKQKAQLAQQAHEDTPAAELPEADAPSVSKSPEHKEVDRARIELFVAGIAELTAKERMIYDCHISGMPTSDIMEKLNIKENTLKFHNKNIYSKLGVSSRKQLQEIYRKVSEIAQNN